MTLTLLLICVVLVVVTTLMHYESLRLISAVIPRITSRGRLRVLISLFAMFIAHVLEIAFYALAYYVIRDEFGLGSFGGQFIDSFSTFLYFSAETYTSVGFGDIYPTGALRLVCGIEALNGLLLIGWSASFTFIYMEHFWRIDAAGDTYDHVARH
jgi:hypothetical protein